MNSLWFTCCGWTKHRYQADTGCFEQYYLSLHFIFGRCKILFLTLSKCAPMNILLANYTVSFDDEKIWCSPFHRSRRPSFAKLRRSRIQGLDFPISHRTKLFWRRIYSWPRFLCVMSMNLTPTSSRERVRDEKMALRHSKQTFTLRDLWSVTNLLW
jgi:hypothetical protein